MEDWGNGGTNSSSYDIGGYNAVRVPYTQCGCVYQLDVSAALLRGLATSAAGAAHARPGSR